MVHARCIYKELNLVNIHHWHQHLF